MESDRKFILANEVPIYILAGGRSSRFRIPTDPVREPAHDSDVLPESSKRDLGEDDKASVSIDGRPQLLRLLEELQSYGYSVQVISDRPGRHQKLGIQSLEDHSPGSGPLSALMVGLQHRAEQMGQGWLLLLSCDQLLWRNQWAQSLWQVIEAKTQKLRGKEQQFDSMPLPFAACFEEEKQAQPAFLQPIPAFYETGMLSALQEEFGLGERSLRKFLEKNRSRVVSARTQENPRQWCFNTWEELQALQTRRANSS